MAENCLVWTNQLQSDTGELNAGISVGKVVILITD